MTFVCRQSPSPDPPLSVNAFCIVTNSAHETPVYPQSFFIDERPIFGAGAGGAVFRDTGVLTVLNCRRFARFKY